MPLQCTLCRCSTAALAPQQFKTRIANRNMRVTATALVYQEKPPDVRENLSAIDASPLLLKVVNCPVVKLNYSLSFDRLRGAVASLLEEYPIIGGRLRKVSKHEITRHSHLKSAPYCIDLAHPESGVVLCDARADCSINEINLHAHLAHDFSLLKSKVDLPSWYQPLDISALIKGKEPLLKLQLTHTTDGGCVLAATMPHLLADSHSSTLLLTRLAELYRRKSIHSNSTCRPSTKHSTPLHSPLARQAHTAPSPFGEPMQPEVVAPDSAELPAMGRSTGRELSASDSYRLSFGDWHMKQHRHNRPDINNHSPRSSTNGGIMQMISLRKSSSGNLAVLGLMQPAENDDDMIVINPGVTSTELAQLADSPRLSSAIISQETFTGARSFNRHLSSRSSNPGDRSADNSSTQLPILSPITSWNAPAGGVTPTLCSNSTNINRLDSINYTQGSTAAADTFDGDATSLAPTGVVYSQLRMASTLLKDVSGRSGRQWSKAALLSVNAGGVPVGSAGKDSLLKTLSLDLQSTEAPSLPATVHWLRAAVKDGLAAAKTHPRGTTLTARLLHIPAADLLHLKVLAAAGTAHKSSTNDVISALVWLMFCDLRGRTLPGSSSSSSNAPTTPPAHQGGYSTTCCSIIRNKNVCDQNPDTHSGAQVDDSAGGYLGMAIDLRYNCKDVQQQLPANYFGNAAWGLHISADSTTSHGVDRGAQRVKDKNAAANADCAGVDVCSFAPALRAAACAVRRGVDGFRSTDGAGGELLQLVTQQQAASKRVLVCNLARLAVKVDGFITNWQFPVQNINFGAGPPIDYCCTVRPTPPWQAAVLPRLGPSPGPAEELAGGVKLLLTVPASAVGGLRRSKVLKQLVPNAVFLT